MSQDDQTYNRWIPVFLGVLIQLCLGSVYIWGVFQPAVVKMFGWNHATAALTFSFCLGVFTIGSVIGGMYQDKLGPKRVLMASAVILSIGFWMAGYTTADKPWWLWMCYGVIGGGGMGATYPTIIVTCQKWFPDRRGLVTGIVVAALGFGGLIFTPLARMWVAEYGVLVTFQIFSVIFFVVTMGCGFFFRIPQPGFAPAGWKPSVAAAAGMAAVPYTASEASKTWQFWVMGLVLGMACSTGLMIIPFAKVLGLQGGLTDAVATSAVMVIAAANSGGRLFWGAMSDKLGRTKTILMLLLIAGTCMLFLAAAKEYTILGLIFVIALSYGGYLGVFPALVADYFGTKAAGMIYGLLLLFFGVAAVGAPLLAGKIRDATGGFVASFMTTAILSFVAAVLVFMLKPPAKKSS
jgi:OFA family oxalate/formate antiporter-like MFS transporter